MITLRDYQRAAIDATMAYWETEGGNPLVEMATGTGKSAVVASICQEIMEVAPQARILMLVHVRELVAQNAQQILRMWPGAPIGINSAGLGRRDTRHPIICASIQSVHRHAAKLGQRDLIIIDEAHLVPKHGDGMYHDLIGEMRATTSPDLRVFGCTATPYRLDSGRLDRGQDRFFDRIVYSYGIGEGVRDGHLSPLVSKGMATQIDVSGVGKRGGEFIAGALEEAADRSDLTRAAVDEIVALGADRRSWLVFATSVKHAHHIREEIERRGVSCAVVSAETPKDERDRILAAFKAGRIRCIANMAVLTTGFDAPSVDLIAMLRPTLSTGLYVQILGRGTRKALGKDNCIAEGQLVLTDQGLVPIEHVKISMKVWDGIEFVSHCGIVFSGNQEVISYAGLTATSDHKVWTKEGWKTFGECALKQIPISIAGIFERPVREADGHFRRCRESWRRQPCLLENTLQLLRRCISKKSPILEEIYGWVQAVRKPTARPQVAFAAGNVCKDALHQSERQSISSIWRAWHHIRISIAARYGGLDTGKSWPSSRVGVGQDQQRRPLWAGKFALRYFIRSKKEHAPRRSVAKVYDIINCGPRHRFTVEGLLVSNCLILDFSGNVRRHGPVDDIVISTPGKSGKALEDFAAKEDTVRAKECPRCHSMMAVQARVCGDCGHEFASDAKHEAVADVAPIMSGKAAPDPWRKVTDVQFFRHVKRNALPGTPPTLRVTYGSGVAAFSEFVCFEHPVNSFPWRKAQAWWRERMGAMPVPTTVDEALSRTGELCAVEEVKIMRDGDYNRVVAVRNAAVQGGLFAERKQA